ncbi:MAG: NAD(P)-binding domain-containing protein, partial [Acidobacteria bacterium]|nr:NAD(P)-binding domain-containing protein [Acidobacteriota bacterium]
GDSAVEAAMGLARQPGNEVTLSYRKDRIFRIKTKNQERLEKMIRRGRLKTLLSSHLVEVGAKTVQLEVEGSTVTLENDYVLILIGGEPPFPLLRQMGIKFRDETDTLRPPPRPSGGFDLLTLGASS